jgi:hypothetical protein
MKIRGRQTISVLHWSGHVALGSRYRRCQLSPELELRDFHQKLLHARPFLSRLGDQVKLEVRGFPQFKLDLIAFWYRAMQRGFHRHLSDSKPYGKISGSIEQTPKNAIIEGEVPDF